jgi:hypothetical protein
VHPVLGEETLFLFFFYHSLGLDLFKSSRGILFICVHAEVRACAFFRVTESTLSFPGFKLGLCHQSALLGRSLKGGKVL